MVLSSKLNGLFSAGLDLQEMYKPNEARAKAFWRSLQELWLRLYAGGSAVEGEVGGATSSLMLAAAMNGHSPAGIFKNATRSGLVSSV